MALLQKDSGHDPADTGHGHDVACDLQQDGTETRPGWTGVDSPATCSGARTPHAEPPADPARVAWFAAMRELVEFLEGRPDLPLPGPYGRTDVTVIAGTDLALVEDIAARLGVQVTGLEHGQPTAEVSFGEDVRYRVIGISAERMERHDALMTYHESVTP